MKISDYFPNFLMFPEFSLFFPKLSDFFMKFWTAVARALGKMTSLLLNQQPNVTSLEMVAYKFQNNMY